MGADWAMADGAIVGVAGIRMVTQLAELTGDAVTASAENRQHAEHPIRAAAACQEEAKCRAPWRSALQQQQPTKGGSGEERL